MFQGTSWYYRLNLFGEREYSRNLKITLSDHIAKYSQSQHDVLDVERIKDVVGRDCDLVASGFSMTLTGITQLLAFMSTAVLLFTFDARLSLIVLAITLLGWHIADIHGKRLSKCSHAYGDAAADLITDIEEKIYLHPITDVLALHKSMEKRSDHVLTGMKHVEDRFADAEDTYENTSESFTTFIFLLSMLVGMLFVRSGDLRVGNYIGFLSAVGQLNSSMLAYMTAIERYHLVRVALSNMKLVMALEPLLFGEECATNPSSSMHPSVLADIAQGHKVVGKASADADSDAEAGTTTIDTWNQGELAGKKIEFVGVWFSYPASVSRILYSDLSFAVPLFGCTALIGKSGSGKSTFARLLMRLFQPCAGHVLVGGHDINDLRIEDLFSWCDQETILFSGTIRENILVADPSCSFARMRRAAKIAESCV